MNSVCVLIYFFVVIHTRAEIDLGSDLKETKSVVGEEAKMIELITSKPVQENLPHTSPNQPESNLGPELTLVT